MPWSVEAHDPLLTELLGPRPTSGRPAKLEALADEVRAALGAADPQPRLPARPAARRCGPPAATSSRPAAGRSRRSTSPPPSRCSRTRSWPGCSAPTAGRGWTPGSTTAGSAPTTCRAAWSPAAGRPAAAARCSCPRSIRGAVRADDGWKLVVADAAQLEPRVLAAMSGDAAMAAAGRQADLYQGVVDAGIVETRAQAKVAMLGAIYGATTGPSAVLMPRLDAGVPAGGRPGRGGGARRRARRGRRDLARPDLPAPDAAWQDALAAASAEGAGADDVRAARQARARLGTVHAQLRRAGHGRRVGAVLDGRRCAGGCAGPRRPHLVFFLHDEVMVHSPGRRGRGRRRGRARVGARGRPPAVRQHRPWSSRSTWRSWTATTRRSESVQDDLEQDHDHPERDARSPVSPTSGQRRAPARYAAAKPAPRRAWRP